MPEGLQLERLLEELFSTAELHRFIRTLPDGQEMARSLPSDGASIQEQALQTAQALERRGGLTERFWLRLAAQRPRKTDLIEQTRASLQGADSAALAQETARPPSSQASDRRAPDRARKAKVSVLLDAHQIHNTFHHNPDAADALLSKPLTDIDDNLLVAFFSMVDACRRRSRTVGLQLSDADRTVRLVETPNQLAAWLVADFALGSSGIMKWLVRETARLVRNDGLNIDRLADIWREIALRQDEQMLPSGTPNSIEAFIQSVRASLEDKPQLMFPFFKYVWAAQGDSPAVVRATIAALRAVRDELDPRNTRLRSKWSVLLGLGEDRFLQDERRFKPKLVSIAEAGSYDFDAMVCPLTQGEFAALMGEVSAKDPYHPYRLGPWDWNHRGPDHYPSISSSIRAILEACQLSAHRPGYVWRLPTVAEWLRLSGCDRNEYPWGADAPTSSRANLSFRGAESVRPVGSYPLGASPDGILDCVGNVYELVLVRNSRYLPQDGRLMGGCFRTRAEEAAGSRIRKIVRREPDMRRNIGVRLVRVPVDAEQMRWDDVQALLDSHRLADTAED